MVVPGVGFFKGRWGNAWVVMAYDLFMVDVRAKGLE